MTSCLLLILLGNWRMHNYMHYRNCQKMYCFKYNNLNDSSMKFRQTCDTNFIEMFVPLVLLSDLTKQDICSFLKYFLHAKNNTLISNFLSELPTPLIDSKRCPMCHEVLLLKNVSVPNSQPKGHARGLLLRSTFCYHQRTMLTIYLYILHVLTLSVS